MRSRRLLRMPGAWRAGRACLNQIARGLATSIRCRERQPALPPSNRRSQSLAELVDLAEVIAVDDVDEDHRGLVVAFLGPGDRLGVGDALKCQRAHSRDDIGARRRAFLALRA